MPACAIWIVQATGGDFAEYRIQWLLHARRSDVRAGNGRFGDCHELLERVIGCGHREGFGVCHEVSDSLQSWLPCTEKNGLASSSPMVKVLAEAFTSLDSCRCETSRSRGCRLPTKRLEVNPFDGKLVSPAWIVQYVGAFAVERLRRLFGR